MEKKVRAALADALSLWPSIRPIMDSEKSSEINPYETPLHQEVTEAAAPLRPKLPQALQVVAWLTLGEGALTVIGAINSVFQDHVHMNLNVLCIPAGIGLFKLRRGWRTFTLVMIWLMISVSLLIAVIALFSPEPLEIRLMGFKKAPIPDGMVIPGAILHFVLSLWQYRVLTRWDVKALFGLHGKNVPRPDEM